jgi:hypothetical protein
MRRLCVWTIAILVLSAPAVARAGDNDGDDTTPKGSWFGRLFQTKSQPATKAKDPQAEKKAAAEKYATTVKAAKATQARELSDLLRRSAVCEKLWDIAMFTNDNELLRKAEQLNQRAWDMYQQRTNKLPVGAPTLHSDERVLDRRLGTNTSVGQSLLPASGPNASSQAAIREVRQ